MNSRTLWRERRTIHAPASTPKRIPPQTPSPPFQTANGAHQALIALTSLQLVRSWYARAPTMPKATPHTATRKTTSQSPPPRTHRHPVRATQAAIASSSSSPYMWIVSGPTSIVPLCGDGMYASNLTDRRFCPQPPEPAVYNRIFSASSAAQPLERSSAATWSSTSSLAASSAAPAAPYPASSSCSARQATTCSVSSRISVSAAVITLNYSDEASERFSPYRVICLARCSI